MVFRLARELKGSGNKVLVTTSTRLKIPHTSECDHLDLSGNIFREKVVEEPGIYVAGVNDTHLDKMRGVGFTTLVNNRKRFDVVLIEADGAAGKPLKGWKSSEPVVPPWTTHTIGVVDIQTIGKEVNEELVHRLEIFLKISGATRKESVSHQHLASVVINRMGLFYNSVGRKNLFINKVESKKQAQDAKKLKSLIPGLKIVYGSLHSGTCYD